MSTTMKVGVVGLGYWGSKVVREYVRLRNEGRLDGVFVCDRDESKLGGIEEVDGEFGSAEELTGEVDALHVCTDNHTHHSIADHALRNQTDVLVEKPLTTDRKTAYDLVERASENGQILQSGHIFRFAEVVRDVKQKYEEGFFGDVRYFTLRWTHDIDPIQGTDVFWDLLPHPIDILNFITGEWPNNPGGLADNNMTTEGHEAANVQFELGDSLATVQVSWVDPIRRRTLEVAGEERGGVAECTEQTLEIHGGNGVEELGWDNNTLRDEALNFIESIETGRNTFNSAIVGARTVDAIQSIREEVVGNDR